jgi:hypothetical protein
MKIGLAMKSIGKGIFRENREKLRIYPSELRYELGIAIMLAHVQAK